MAQYTSSPLIIQTNAGELVAVNNSNPAYLALLASGEEILPYVPPPADEFLARDLFYQFTAGDVARLQIAIEDESTAARAAIAAQQEPSAPLRLLWDSLTAQGEWKIRTTSQQFKDGWGAMTAILGATRMEEIAIALYINPDAVLLTETPPA